MWLKSKYQEDCGHQIFNIYTVYSQKQHLHKIFLLLDDFYTFFSFNDFVN